MASGTYRQVNILLLDTPSLGIECLPVDYKLRFNLIDFFSIYLTFRLLSWATRNLEPYGVDYILNKLGFSHARTTIPKWLQRGSMDPLDKILSVLMYRMIQAIHDHDAANK